SLFEDGLFREELLQTGFGLRWTVKSLGERLPLAWRHGKRALIGQGLLGSCAGAFENEIGDVHAAHLRPRADECFLLRRGAQIDAAASRPLRGGHKIVSF